MGSGRGFLQNYRDKRSMFRTVVVCSEEVSHGHQLRSAAWRKIGSVNDDEPAEFIAPDFPAVAVGTGIKLAGATDRHARLTICGTQRSSLNSRLERERPGGTCDQAFRFD